jgi:hypothetical protein
MGFSDLIYLVDIDQVLDINTGKNKLQITRETPVYADRQEVGMEEYYSAIGNNITLSASYEIPASSYHGEKYIITGDRKHQFEISRVGKGRNLSYLRLPVKAVQNKQLLEGMTSG